LGIELKGDEGQLVLQRIRELGDQKHTVLPEDLPMLIADVLHRPTERVVSIEDYEVRVARGAAPFARLTVSVGGVRQSAEATGAGGYDALMNALKVIAGQLGIDVPYLVDYRVRIPPGGRTEALVEARVTWRRHHEDESTFTTRGVDSDQLAAAVLATERMLNLVVLAPSAVDAATTPSVAAA